MQIQAFFETQSSTLCYLVWDESSGDAVVIDPVLNYDPVNHKVSTTFADDVLSLIEAKGLKLHWSLETHVHADHLSAGAYIRDKMGAKVGISEAICAVQETFVEALNLDDTYSCDGRSFDGRFGSSAQLTKNSTACELSYDPSSLRPASWSANS